ncbi:MAG: tetratricopeptide repeat protein [Gemmatimonadales bacterium]
MTKGRSAVVVSILCIAAVTAAGATRASISGRHVPSSDSTRVSDLAQRDVQISAWKKALAADSESAIALGQLAGLYMQRGRETGDETNYATAEAYARRSVVLRTNRNGAAFVTLASAMLAQHEFVEADSIVNKLIALEPDIPQYRALRGEIKLELGDYSAARSEFDSLYQQRTHLSIAPRLARWLEISGRSDAARKLLYESLFEAKRRRDLPLEQLAWFYLRTGDIEQRQGRTRTARSLFGQGLQVHPDDYRLLAAMARLEAAEGRPKNVIDYGERAIAVKLDPATLGLIGDAYADIGDSAQAEEYFKTMEVAVSGQPGAYHRAWSLFLLDHERRIPEVLANVTSEVETRRDVYGYDLLAWALSKSGKPVEASAAMNQAMRMHTDDPMLLFHAGVIEHSIGNNTTSRAYLTRALEINPKFNLKQAARARAMIESMER